MPICSFSFRLIFKKWLHFISTIGLLAILFYFYNSFSRVYSLCLFVFFFIYSLCFYIAYYILLSNNIKYHLEYTVRMLQCMSISSLLPFVLLLSDIFICFKPQRHWYCSFKLVNYIVERFWKSVFYIYSHIHYLTNHTSLSHIYLHRYHS